jgi:hypothetical protein
LADSPLTVELQLMAKLNADCASRATASVRVWLPLVAFVPGQLSLGPPPVAVQLVALDDVHVSVVVPPAVMVVGEAEIDTVTGGQFQTTWVDTLTAGTPGAVHSRK